MSLKIGTTQIAGLNTNAHSLFDFKWSDHLQDDMNWLRADTFSWQDGTVYSNAYNKLVSEYNNAIDIEINAIKIGTPTISSSGVVSGFNTSNYLKTPTFFNPTTQDFEFLFKFTTGNDVTTNQTLTATLTNQGITITILNSKFVLSIGNGSSWVVTDLTGTTTISTNTTYYVKFTRVGNVFTLYSSTDNSTWSTECTTTNSTSVSSGLNTQGIGISRLIDVPFLGSIDLKESYIKINNSIWWSGEFCKRSPKGYKIVTANKEQAILDKYNTDGIAWYYILDTANTRFKLPRTKFGFEGLRTSVGNDIAESLPNIKGTTITSTASNYYDTSLQPTEAFDKDSSHYASLNGGSAGTINVFNGTFNASRSSSTYQNNAPVQERATQMYLYFYVGQFSQIAIEQTAGITSEQLNAKVDPNASNLNATGKSLISGLPMPSNRYIDLTPGASGSSYTAPANGWFVGTFMSTSTSSSWFAVNSNTSISNGLDFARQSAWGRYCIPVKKGDVVTVTFDSATWYLDRFVYAEGEPNE